MKHIISLLLSVFILSFNALAEISPSKVFIVANSDDADSIAIAEFYAAARGVPKGNIISSYISHDIDFLVLCRGVPWGINPTPGSPAPNPPKSFSDAASVDSEISGRFVSSKSFAGFVKNPLFNNYSWAMTPSIT